MYISEINSYPLKSAKAEQHSTVIVRSVGIEGDRRYMLVRNETGKFISLRDADSKNLALLSAWEKANGSLVIKKGSTNIFTASCGAKIQTINYRGQDLTVNVFSPEVNLIMSQYMGFDVTLVKSRSGEGFNVDGDINSKMKNEGLSDGFPILIANQGSLDALQQQVGDSIQLEMSRFRPNFVVTGATAFDEDSWKTIKIGGVIFDLPKPCKRCAIITVDPKTGERGKEPLKTLAAIHKGREVVDGKTSLGAYFGMNAIPRIFNNNFSEIRLQSKVEVLERYSDRHPIFA